MAKSKRYKRNALNREIKKERISWYDGSNPESREICCMAKCNSSKSMEREEYLKCNNCQTFYYCSSQCLRKDSQRHRNQCQRIEKLRSDIDVLYQNVDVMLVLCSTYTSNRDTTNTHVGNINKRRFPAVFTYLCARMKLVDELTSVAKEFSLTTHWDELNSILQENLRLCYWNYDSKPFNEWCRKFSTALLDCGRIEDSLSFTCNLLERHAMKKMTKEKVYKGRRPRPSTDCTDLASRNKILSESVEGQWIYPHAVDFDNRILMKVDAGRHLDHVDLYLVFVVYLCKLKQFMIFTLIWQAMDSFRQSGFGECLDALEGPMGIILEYIIPFPSLGITSRSMFSAYCNKLHASLWTLTKYMRRRNVHLFRLMLQYHQEEGKNGSGTGTGISTRPGSEYYAIDFIHRCAYSLQSIPDLDVWAKYCCPEEEGSN